MNETSPEFTPKQLGVISYHIENNQYLLSVLWADNKESTVHYPAAGVTVIDPTSHREIARLNAEQVLKVYQEHAPHMTREEFSLAKILSKKKT